jgi:uncharacterized protein YndB with AHSA1/START domain
MDVAMAREVETGVIEREILISASPETIWELLVDPKQMTRWMGLEASVDLRTGGIYRVRVLSGHVASGRYVEIDPPRRLVYTFGWEHENAAVLPGSTTVSFELTPRPEGTLLRFTHSNLPTTESVASHTHGWEHYLERLRAAGSGEPLGEDPWIANPPHA